MSYRKKVNAIKHIIHNLIIGKNKNHKKQGYIWNSVAGLINASEAIFLSAVITRTNGLYDAGVLSIAFAVGNLMMMIGKYGMRNYQVSDSIGRMSFNNYYSTRIITCGFMLIISFVYVLVNQLNGNYTVSKAIIVILMCFMYCVECIEDVFGGMMQKAGRLDVSSKIFSFRWIMILLMYSFCLITTKDLVQSTIAAVCVNTLTAFVFVKATYRDYENSVNFVFSEGVIKILKDCFPLCISTFLSFYIINSPKYAIDSFLSEIEQAYYGYVSMPVFAIGLVNTFIYQPVLADMAKEWESGSIKQFSTRVIKQNMILAALTLAALSAAYLIGIPVLSALYGVDLKDYKNLLMILITNGAILAGVGYFNVVLTVMRKQRELMLCYMGEAIFTFLIVNYMVKTYGLMGAAVSLLPVQITMNVVLIVITVICCHKAKTQK